VNTLIGTDPFNTASTIKLIKVSPDPTPATPEMSVGGAFSIDGSAYTSGCDRIITQYVLARFTLSPTGLTPPPVPTEASAAGGVNIIAPVVYMDSDGHPWSSIRTCPPPVFLVPNTFISPGDLVAAWSSLTCFTFVPTPLPGHFVSNITPYVQSYAWDTIAPLLNGRYIIVLEVDDHPVPSIPFGTFPGSIAAVDQVAVWIDNWQPTATIKSIGNVVGCGDLRLSDYKGTTAEILGQAWDPPIDATAQQLRPNDNFGSYSLTFQKNGGGGGVIPGATPNTRVPNIWPGPLGSAVGTLANWDIVTALNGGTSPGPGQLGCGERCAYVITLSVSDTTHVGDSGSNHIAGPVLFALNIINDLC
jgi:hypothetical protein